METAGAHILREQTGTSGLEQTVRAAVALLADHDIPHLIAGGLAVQEHGYFRVTLDADIIVPDPAEAVEFLTGDLSGPFARVPECEDTLEDKRTGIQINFLPATGVVKAACRVPFPQPTQVSATPQFVPLEMLLSLKLDSWHNSPARRARDKGDVVELILKRKLPRDFAVEAAVRPLYERLWDELAAESSPRSQGSRQ